MHIFNVHVQSFQNENNSNTDKKESSMKNDKNREIETLLLIHEKKTNSTVPLTGNADAEESESSDSEAEMSMPNIAQFEGLLAL